MRENNQKLEQKMAAMVIEHVKIANQSVEEKLN
jgi:hypothetical protein